MATGVAVTDLPPQRSSNAEALAAYAAGMQTWRDGSIDRAADFFETASKLDPGMGAGFLRVALRSQHTPVERAAFFKEAVDRRASLAEHEGLLLDAMAPCIQGRAREEDHWCVDRTADAARRAPRDAELAFWSAKTLLDAGRFRDAVAVFDRALELDPKFGLAWVVRIHALSYLGEFDEAERAIPLCSAVTPTDRCLMAQIKLDKPRGRCAEVGVTARAMLGLDPANPAAVQALALAEDAAGRSPSAVKSVADQLIAVSPEHARDSRRGWVNQAVAESQGAFGVALAALAERETALRSSRELQAHAELTEARILLDWEVGEVAAAGAAGRAYLEKRDGLLSAGAEDDVRMRAETPAFALLAELRAGLITKSELRAERDRFVASWRPRLGPGYRPFLWLDAYAASVDDADDAREALDALASFGGLPSFFYYDPLQDLIGRTYLLAGRTDEAIPWLERAARACELPFSARPITARLLLGRAREDKGDHDAACAAYGAVIERWGHATPKSVTLEEAKRRRKAIGCR